MCSLIQCENMTNKQTGKQIKDVNIQSNKLYEYDN